MAKRRKGRPLTGVLLVDKPHGMSSNGLLQKVRWLYQAQKAGHTGALDPAATGLLPICFGEATKFTQFLLDADKRYRTTGLMGVQTDTLDAEGEITKTAKVPVITQASINSLIDKQFLGDIEQIPPMYSALKRDGKKLYELAREGQSIELEARPVTVFQNEIVSWQSPELTLDVHCSKGTYIRTLMADIGDALGCGAHVTQLRRTSHGKFQLENAVSLDQLIQMQEAGDTAAMDSLLLSIDVLLEDFPAVSLSEKYTRLFSHGNDIQHEPGSGKVRVYSSNNQFLGIGEITEQNRLKPVRLVAQEQS